LPQPANDRQDISNHRSAQAADGAKYRRQLRAKSEPGYRMSRFRKRLPKWSSWKAFAALPAVALIGTLLWSHALTERSDQRHLALRAAQSVARKIDVYFGGLEILLREIGAAVSTNPNDVDVNDALLQCLKSELPRSVANILILALDGRNIGNAVGQHAGAGDRDYFQMAVATGHLVVGEPIQSRSDLGWVIPVAWPVLNNGGDVQAVLVVAVFLDSFRDVIASDGLPNGSIVRIVNRNEIELAVVSNESVAIGPHVRRLGSAARQFRLVEGSEIVKLYGGLTRVVGFSRTQRIPWLVAVGLSPYTASATVAEEL
jgi:hypothetical protein